MCPAQKWRAKSIKYFVVAECGINHLGSMETAKAMIDATVSTGADAVKFQFYDWKDILHELPDKNLLEMVKQSQLSLKDLSKLRAYTKKSGINFGCTPFRTREKLAKLARIKPDFVKIRFKDGPSSSADKVGLLGPALEMPSVRQILCSVLGRPVDLMSIMWNPKVTWLYCLPMYPPQPEDFHPALMTSCNGFSDHFPYITASLVAAAVTRDEVYVIEKHVMMEDVSEVPDFPVSVDFAHLQELVEHLRLYERLKPENKMWFPLPPKLPMMVKRKGKGT
jgi:sialic acid synthase SpsE